MFSQTRITLDASPGLALLVLLGWSPLLVLAGFAVSGLLALPLVALILGIAVFQAVQLGLRKGSRRIRELVLNGDELAVTRSDGARVPILPGLSCRLFSRLILLEFTAAAAPRKALRERRLVITDLPGLANVSPDDLRRLKVWLRMRH